MVSLGSCITLRSVKSPIRHVRLENNSFPTVSLFFGQKRLQNWTKRKQQENTAPNFFFCKFPTASIRWAERRSLWLELYIHSSRSQVAGKRNLMSRQRRVQKVAIDKNPKECFVIVRTPLFTNAASLRFDKTALLMWRSSLLWCIPNHFRLLPTASRNLHEFPCDRRRKWRTRLSAPARKVIGLWPIWPWGPSSPSFQPIQATKKKHHAVQRGAEVEWQPIMTEGRERLH